MPLAFLHTELSVSMKKTLHLVTAATSLMASLAVGNASADLQAPAGPPPSSGSYNFTLPPSSDDITRTEWADIDGDGQEDAIFLMGDSLLTYLAPGIHETVISDLSGPLSVVHDFAIARNPIGNDAVLLVDAAGLVELQFNTTTRPYAITRNVIGAFTGAVKLDVWSDNNGNHWAVGTNQSGATLFLADDLNGTWTPRTSVPSNSPSSAIDLVLFGNDGTNSSPKALFLTTAGFAISDPFDGGVTSVNMNPVFSYKDVARLSRGSQLQPDALAFLGVGPSGDFFAVLSDGEVSSYELLDSEDEIYAISTGRFSPDLLDDIALAGRLSKEIFVMIDGAANAEELPNFTFSTEHSVVYDDSPGTAAAQTATPLIADLDHDGDGDILVAISSSGLLKVELNGTLDADEQKAAMVMGTYQELNPAPEPEDLPLSGHLYSQPNAANPLEFDWMIDFRVSLPATLPSTYLDVLTWRTPANQMSIDATPVDSQRIELSQAAAGTTITITLSADEPGEAFQNGNWSDQLYTILQFVEAPSLTTRQTYCYPANALVYAPDSEIFNPPHEEPPTFGVFVEPNPLASTYQDGDPDGAGDCVDCVPASTPPRRP
ncbi:MAG: hypothetical protein ACI8X5_004000 [Planctomycetota bacterium]|jgi:hypothetical protein